MKRETFGLFPPGTYYLSIDTYGDAAFGGGVEGPFDVDLVVTEFLPPASIDLGLAALEGEPIAIDSLGSDFDTELGLYDSNGFLLATNDDIDFPAIPQSEILIPGGLPEGTYYVALGGFNTVFGDEIFDVAALADSAGGNYVINVNDLTTSRGLDPETVEWFSFQVAVPEPTSAVVALLLGLACVAGRRN